MPTVGTCKLCRSNAEIQSSHLIPRAIYVDLRKPHLPNPNPIMGLPEETGPRQEQVEAPLLCSNCLFQLLSAAKPISEQKWTVYAGAEIDGLDMDKISYFGASVFWRASAGQWSMGGKRREMIDLGERYEEQLRAFLAGEASFPRGMVLWSAVCRTPEPPPVISFPTGELVSDGVHSYHQHIFNIPGISYMLLVGNRIPDHVREFCIIRSARRFIYFSPIEEIIERNTARVFRASPPSQSLRKMHRKLWNEEL